eukprot:GHVQ01018882.1.p1 GENE.GHVQ01018882.1~~GHVQ01018882.1.p1  ORF type:complete len:424 (-),score=77.41 GHVQ01018882.1:74-1345(-)
MSSSSTPQVPPPIITSPPTSSHASSDGKRSRCTAVVDDEVGRCGSTPGSGDLCEASEECSVGKKCRMVDGHASLSMTDGWSVYSWKNFPVAQNPFALHLYNHNHPSSSSPSTTTTQPPLPLHTPSPATSPPDDHTRHNGKTCHNGKNDDEEAKSVREGEKISDKAIENGYTRELEGVERRLCELPPVVTAEEVSKLRSLLAEVYEGKRFLIQAGDCAERFEDCDGESIRVKLKIILQMSLIISWMSHVPTVRVGRIAGQYAKPRSSDFETTEAGESVVTFRGDCVNGIDAKNRKPDPDRLVQAYFYSAATLNCIRSLLAGGFADLHQSHHWQLDYVMDNQRRVEYEGIVTQLLNSLSFMQACGCPLGDTVHITGIYRCVTQTCAQHTYATNIHITCRHAHTHRHPHRLIHSIPMNILTFNIYI